MGKAGFPVTKNQLLDSVAILLRELKRHTCFTNGRPGRHWYEAFLRRHQEISVRTPQNLSKARSAVTEKNMRKWFAEILSFSTEESYLDILQDPGRIFNCDECAIYLCPRVEKVSVRAGQKAVYNFTKNDEKECITTLIMGNAASKMDPPLLMFALKIIPSKLSDSIPPS